MKLLFVAYGGGHINALVPVAKLARRAGHSVVVIALTTARRAAINAGLEPLSMSSLSPFAGEGAERYGRELAQAVSGGPVGFEESAAYLGTSFAELVEDLGEKNAYKAYGESGRSIFLPVRFFERALRSLAPDVVVATSAPRSERAAIMAAGRCRIPAVCVVDLFATAEVDWVGENGYANRVCVVSESVKQHLVDQGRTPHDIFVSGNPAFDGLADSTCVEAGRKVRAQAGWEQRFVVAWASQPEPARHPFTGERGNVKLPQKLEKSLVSWAAAQCGRGLIVRHHPNESRRQPTPSSTVRFSSPDEPVEAMLHSCDCLVTIASTVGLQAALIGLPVVTYDSSILTSGAPYSSIGMSLGISDLGELPTALETIRTGKWQSTSGLAVPGEAALNVLQCAESLV